MKSRESLIRVHRFQVDEKRRTVVQIETMIADFDTKIADLEQQIDLEQKKSGIDDITHYAYPTFAKAAVVRRDNLQASKQELKQQLEEAKNDLAAAFSELKRMELLAEREQAKLQRSQMVREQSGIDEAALNLYRQDEFHR
ncbi:MAG: flagellar export protein FliJ [Hyphomicrobiales bacterium]|nr:MAG: flagellar export protein FliJ [Hyphomicrobiales bacterium]